MDNTIRTELSQFICEQILMQPDRSIKPDEPLISSGLIDSFNLVDLALHVEDNYSVKIEDTELNASTFDNLDQLVTIIQGRIAE